MITLSLSYDDVKKLERLREAWRVFKVRRNRDEFFYEQGEGFLTVLEREGMIDRLLNLCSMRT